MNGLINIYTRWIEDPEKDFTIDDVPEYWREKVKEHLDAK